MVQTLAQGGCLRNFFWDEQERGTPMPRSAWDGQCIPENRRPSPGLRLARHRSAALRWPRSECPVAFARVAAIFRASPRRRIRERIRCLRSYRCVPRLWSAAVRSLVAVVQGLRLRDGFPTEWPRPELWYAGSLLCVWGIGVLFGFRRWHRGRSAWERATSVGTGSPCGAACVRQFCHETNPHHRLSSRRGMTRRRLLWPSNATGNWRVAKRSRSRTSKWWRGCADERRVSPGGWRWVEGDSRVGVADKCTHRS